MIDYLHLATQLGQFGRDNWFSLVNLAGLATVVLKGQANATTLKLAVQEVTKIADHEIEDKAKRDTAVTAVLTLMPAWTKPLVSVDTVSLLVEQAWQQVVKPQLDKFDAVAKPVQAPATTVTVNVAQTPPNPPTAS